MFKWILGALAALLVVSCQAADIPVQYLRQLRDVAIGTQTDGQALVWSAALNRWVPGAGGGGGGGSGAGNGLVLVGTNLHFATSSPYGVAQIPFATGTNTIGFNSAFTFDTGGPLLAVPGGIEVAVSDLDPTVNVQIKGGNPSVFTLPLFVGSPTSGGHAATKTYVDNAVASVSGPVTNFYDTTIITNSFFVSGKGNTLIITNSIKLGDYFVYPLQAGSGITFTTNANPTSGTNITISASSSGSASTWVPVAALTYTGSTNVVMPADGGTNFTLTVTNTTFMAAPSSPPSSEATNTSWLVAFKMDSTGTWAVTWTNKFKLPAGFSIQPTTNANAVSIVTITTSPFTAGEYLVSYPTLDLK